MVIDSTRVSPSSIIPEVLSPQEEAQAMASKAAKIVYIVFVSVFIAG